MRHVQRDRVYQVLQSFPSLMPLWNRLSGDDRKHRWVRPRTDRKFWKSGKKIEFWSNHKVWAIQDKSSMKIPRCVQTYWECELSTVEHIVPNLRHSRTANSFLFILSCFARKTILFFLRLLSTMVSAIQIFVSQKMFLHKLINVDGYRKVGRRRQTESNDAVSGTSWVSATGATGASGAADGAWQNAFWTTLNPASHLLGWSVLAFFPFSTKSFPS